MLKVEADIDSQLEGLDQEADTYFNKSVNEIQLQIQHQNLIDLRKDLYKCYLYLNHIDVPENQDSKAEDIFVMKVKNILEKNLDNDTF